MPLRLIMQNQAKENSEEGVTGWAKYEDASIAYYPNCGRYAYFISPWGMTTARSMDHYLRRLARKKRSQVPET